MSVVPPDLRCKSGGLLLGAAPVNARLWHNARGWFFLDSLTVVCAV